MLLKDVFAYYKDTLLEYSMRNKFENIEVVKYTDYQDGKEEKVLGFYNYLFPNSIYINSLLKEERYEKVLSHEYAHFLSADGLTYHYLDEAISELIASEYNYMPDEMYLSCISNFKLLEDIIGPEPLITMFYSGDDDEFLNIIRKNLSQSDATRLIELLSKSSNEYSDKNIELHSEIRELLCRLYKSINGKDIKEDPNIMYDLIYDTDLSKIESNAKYINIHIMNDYDNYTGIYTIEKLINKGIITEKNNYIGEKNISTMVEYEKLSKEDPNIKFEISGLLSTNSIKIEGILDSKGKFYEFDEPILREQLNDEDIIRKYQGHYIEDEVALEKGYVMLKAIKKFEDIESMVGWKSVSSFRTYKSLNPNVKIEEENGSYGIKISFVRPGVKKMFSEQYDYLNYKTLYNYNSNNSDNELYGQLDYLATTDNGFKTLS